MYLPNLGQSILKVCAIFALLSLSACIGSPNPRNPNVQRHEKKKRRRDLSSGSLRSSKNLKVREPDPVADVIAKTPKNSWIAHDQDVYYHLGETEAKKIFRVYPWLKTPQKRKTK